MPENPTLTTDLTGQGGKIVKVKSDETGFEFQAGGAGGGDLVAANNLSDLASASTARTNLGLGNVNNTSDANKPVSTATQTALNGKSDTSHDHDSDYEPLKGADDNYVTDAEKVKLSNLSGTNTGDQTSIVGITGTLAEFNTACSDANFASGGGTATGTNTGDQTSIVGISGTKAQFDTACSDGNFLFVGDQPALSNASAFATAETTISAATYADITGCSVSLAAGTWIIFAHVVARAANAIIQCFGAITHSDNTVISESANSRPASGTASLNSPISFSWFAIVSPGSTTTYKLRGARGLTTHTTSWIAMDGTGFNTTNHASNNSDKGTGIFAIRIA